MSEFTTVMCSAGNNRVLFVFRSEKLNISYISTTQKCSLSFNLEVITKEKAEEQINKLKKNIDFNWEEIIDNTLDFNVVCHFEGKTDEEILKELNYTFNLGLTFEKIISD